MGGESNIMFDTTKNVFVQMSEEKCLSLIENGNDILIYPDIPDGVINKLRNNFQLHIDEIILYMRDTSFWNSRNQGTVVTDWGITCIPDNDTPEEIVQISWEKVLYVE